MIFDPSTAQHLKPWLVRTLEPICDAEPSALADYILALLKHNVPETDMRKELASQLDEFLEKEGPSFIDTLFTVLRTKSYLPYSASDPTPSYSSSSKAQNSDTGIPIPLDGLLQSSPTSSERGQKRSLDHEDRDSRPPAKGPRVSSEGQFSRYSNGRGPGHDSRSTGAWGGRNDRHGMNSVGDMMVPGMNGHMNHMNGRRSQNYQPPDQRRGICRDYYNNGYCARGVLCKYSHGEDAVVPSQLFPMNGSAMAPGPLPFLPMFPNGVMPFAMGAPGGAYDPHEARMDMRPQSGMGGRGQPRAPIIPRIQQNDTAQAVSPHASGELPVIQDLTPQVPPDGNAGAPGEKVENGMMSGGIGSTSAQQPIPTNVSDVEMSTAGPSSLHISPSGNRGGFGNPRSSRGRGTFTAEAHMFRPERRNDKTLVVEKIPEDKLSLGAVNDWFKRFGTVTNVAVDAANAKALVSFSTHEEAHAAWKSEDAVFHNRFVKLFWHRPMEGHGQVGARALAASAPIVATIASKGSQAVVATAPRTESPAATSTPSQISKPLTPSPAVSTLAAKQKLLEQQIAEQKSLMAQLETASAEEKRGIMARLRKLGEEMKPSSSPSATPAPRPSPSPAIAASRSASANAAPRTEDRERQEKERLDKELELHAITVSVTENGGEESTENLKARLEKLKAEAATLGLPVATGESSYGRGYRPYRGRARGGRSTSYRGAARGGPPRVNMKLDNRPKKLLIQGVSDTAAVQAVTEFYEATGQVESVEAVDGGDVVVSFRSRAAAEQGFARGSDIPSVGQVNVAWFSAQQSNGTAAKSAPSTSITQENSKNSDAVQSPSGDVEMHSSIHAPEEEYVRSGWGTDADDDGMGMF